jgi:DNA-binding transcriptional LysR family regulator
MTYTLRQLRYFVAAADYGSVAEASRRLHISEPSISAAIKTLEREFGIQLLIRQHSSGVSLTPAGSRCLRQAKELLRHASDFEANALSQKDALAGHVELGCFVTVAPLYMPKLLVDFRGKYPNVTINLKDGLEDALVRGLEIGKFDLALMYDYGLGLSLQRAPFLSGLKPHLVLPAGHRLAKRKSVSLRSVISEPFILLEGPPSSGYFRSVFEEIGLQPKIAYSSPSLEMVRGLVGRGLGYSILVTRPASNLTYDGNQVATVPISEDVRNSDLVFAWLRNSTLTNTARAFVEFCQAAGKAFAKNA